MAEGKESQHHHVRIKIKGPSNNSNEQRYYYLCAICNRGFTSVYALNGHSRMHSHSDFRKGAPVAANTDNNNVIKTCGGELLESSSTKFPSAMSLFGHMKTHDPESSSVKKREIKPLPFYDDDGASFHSTSSADDSCKRIRRSRHFRRANSRSEQEHCDDPLMQEAAFTLLLLANGNHDKSQQHYAKRMKMMQSGNRISSRQRKPPSYLTDFII